MGIIDEAKDKWNDAENEMHEKKGEMNARMDDNREDDDDGLL